VSTTIPRRDGEQNATHAMCPARAHPALR
jgi:hypothetical protein